MGFSPAAIPALIMADGLYQLTGSLSYTGALGDVFTVPQGFVTDLASVPRFLTALTPVSGRLDPAAILHDFLCEDRRQAERDGTLDKPASEGGPLASAVDTDGLFRRVLHHDLGMNPLTAWIYWGGVRWGAVGSSYRRQGWWSTFPALSVLTLALLPFVALLGVPTLVVLGLLAPVVWLAGIADPLRPQRRKRRLLRPRNKAGYRS